MECNSKHLKKLSFGKSGRVVVASNGVVVGKERSNHQIKKKYEWRSEVVVNTPFLCHDFMLHVY